jgi:hypothetical protein
VRSAITIVAFAVLLMFSDALDWRDRMVNPNSAFAVPFVVFGMLGVAYAIGFGGMSMVRTFLRVRDLRASHAKARETASGGVAPQPRCDVRAEH